jgi:hypothetical protein
MAWKPNSDIMKKSITIFILTLTSTIYGQVKLNPTDFIPKGYVLFEKITGDLNKDTLEDCILIIKSTNKESIVTDRFDKTADRNRRGILILFAKNGGYGLAVKNYNCFSSEQEDGGVYYPPELSVEIKKNKLYLNYSHGRYGYWNYTFRFQNSDFELIGYDSADHHGPLVNSTISINFSTKKKLTRKNINDNNEPGEEIFKETWKKINIVKLLKLSEIKDFDELDVSFSDDEQ